MSKTPAIASGDVNVNVASHLSNVPLRATDAFTLNFIELSALLIWKTGTSAGSCARAAHENKTDAKKQKRISRTLGSVRLSRFLVNYRIQDANSHTTSFTYDAFGRVTKTTFPSGYIETYGYDAVGNLTNKTDRKNQPDGKVVFVTRPKASYVNEVG